MSSYNNIIKSSNTEKKGKISITRKFQEEEPITSESCGEFLQNINFQIQKNKEVAETILENAKTEKEKIINNAFEKAKEIEKKAYEEGFSQGIKNGYEDGYKESYEENIIKAKEESELIRSEANKVLTNSKQELEKYIKENENNILKLSLSIAEQILREKFKDFDSINNLIKHAIEEQELCETYIIKCNELYEQEVRTELNKWKETLVKIPTIFVVADNNIDVGNVVIDKDNGRIVLGLDCGLEKLKNEILGL